MTQDFDETLVPSCSGTWSSATPRRPCSKEEVGGLSDGRGDRLDQELPDLYASVTPRPSTSSGQPPKKRGPKERKAMEWEKRDLSP